LKPTAKSGNVNCLRWFKPTFPCAPPSWAWRRFLSLMLLHKTRLCVLFSELRVLSPAMPVAFLCAHQVDPPSPFSPSRASTFAPQIVPLPPPIMKWYLGANCVGTPGGEVRIALGCADYLIFGTILTLRVDKNACCDTYSITTFVNSGCTGAIGVLFVNVPYPGGDTVCTADTTLDRCVFVVAVRYFCLLPFPSALYPPSLSHSTRCRLIYRHTHTHTHTRARACSHTHPHTLFFPQPPLS
jgi:hypothetical protein